MFLVLLRASSLLYTPSVLLGSLLFFAINACFFIHQKKKILLKGKFYKLRSWIKKHGIWNLNESSNTLLYYRSGYIKLQNDRFYF